ncbi:hypothetical protein PTKIN_Ptkin09bG0205900 [Pterospermum kingtungense]
MAIASDETTRICNHCDRAIPSANIDLHYAHCSRNLEKCKVCGDMVPKKHAEEHFLNTHAPVACSLCSETMERESLAIHKGENCPQRIVTCEFCEFPLPAIDLAEHQEVCGNRTELCHLCHRYIRLRERYNHESRCTGIQENNVGSSRDVRAAERERGPQRRQPPEYSRRRLLLTIAITGIAVLLGSLFFQKKIETSQSCAEVSFRAKEGQAMSSPGVQLHIQDHYVVMDNGILQVTISNPDGIVTGIQYNGIDNLLEVQDEETNGGYWDLVWSKTGSTGTTGTFDVFKGTSFNVIVENEDQVEVSFTRTWDFSLEGDVVPLNLDKRFIMLRNSSGFYSYAIFDHLGEWPPFNLPQVRIVFKLRKDKFHYMAVADNRQRFMPLPDDRLPDRGQPLATPEAVLLVNPVEPEFKGEVDDKYQYSSENKDLKVHGWISPNPPSPIGFWQITPSSEFRSGGPVKQNLTSHVGPYALAMFLSAHYAGEDLVLKLNPGEPWKKVFGPVFLYLNSVTSQDNVFSLWEDAKNQMHREVQNWPYSFPASEDFPKSDQRGKVCGRLQVQDRYVSYECIPANGAYVGLAPPGEVGSWQRECKGYQFWTRADEDGNFTIDHIRTGGYNIYAWVPGFIGDYKYNVVINITEGCTINVGDLIYEPPRDGPTLWEIGIPDRSAAEFNIPDPDPMYINRLYVHHPDRYRQYGLWERYADLYPDRDLVFTVGQSDYKNDWFFAQVNRKKEDGTYQGTTWQIKFMLNNVDYTGTYKLRLALATAHLAELQVRINDPKVDPPLFTTGQIGHDNTIARHGIHGLYRLYNIDMPGDELVEGENIIFLTQAVNTDPLQGIMYDYIRLECPPSSSS